MPMATSQIDTPRRWLIAWRYFDGSASGVIPRVVNDQEKELIELVLGILGSEKEVEFVKVKD